MPGWITNGWLVGIASSLMAGILLSLISWFLLSKRRRHERAQLVMAANREVMYAIRPGIAEGHIPSADVLEAMASATARKYTLERADLFGPAELSDELVKEVMDSSFLSSSQKDSYCAKLTPLRQQQTVAKPSGERDESWRDTALIPSVLLGIISVVATALVQQAFNIEKGGVDDRRRIILTAMAVATVLLSVVLGYLWISSRATVRTLNTGMLKAAEQINQNTQKLRDAVDRARKESGPHG
jgi:hypothetical protein